jgi:hypothetical protein
MIQAEKLRTGNWPEQEIKGRGWFLAKPVSGPFMWRLRDAWKVLTGKAEAVMFEQSGARPFNQKVCARFNCPMSQALQYLNADANVTRHMTSQWRDDIGWVTVTKIPGKPPRRIEMCVKCHLRLEHLMAGG